MPAEAYPVPAAGQRLRASLLRSMQWQTVRKTADTSRSATTTYADDPHLVFPAEANGVYTMLGWVKYFADPTPDIKMQFSVPTDCLGEWGWNMPGSGTTTTGTTGYSIRTETNDVTNGRTGYGTSDSQHMTPLGGTFRMSTTAGNIALQWAQNTSNATATILYTDSFLMFLRIA
ncbi:hypothetical protein PV755_45455 [Streptomyces caniscabiei]|uniref:Uncharacterized protein n=1 Tax=Streptomyces caniscabiei TaxID=2746961 RepID=A0A927L1V6_9ACTN|nr:hypothetical protein [Streptomyces caniscabiei]MBD9723438.1 hypothetical protein [Streptomyces caniscabiei]MDX3516064.1 hypothetical protein [Streptomyces caniscabiei]MDX3725130.1 hypothetical protein [Streptomyces caniscabiei]WEO27008.1 hypothetical protein IHE65_29775 [Streptomyces caniscabiei]